MDCFWYPILKQNKQKKRTTGEATSTSTSTLMVQARIRGHHLSNKNTRTFGVDPFPQYEVPPRGDPRGYLSYHGAMTSIGIHQFSLA